MKRATARVIVVAARSTSYSATAAAAAVADNDDDDDDDEAKLEQDCERAPDLLFKARVSREAMSGAGLLAGCDGFLAIWPPCELLGGARRGLSWRLERVALGARLAS